MASRRQWYPALPEIRQMGDTLKLLGIDPSKGQKSTSNVSMLGVGKNPGSIPIGPDNRNISIVDSILSVDPAEYGKVFWLERAYDDHGFLRENVVYRGNPLALTDPNFYLLSNREHAKYSNVAGGGIFRGCTFLGIAAQAIQTVWANTKAKQGSDGKWRAERKEEVCTKAEVDAGDFSRYWDGFSRKGVLKVESCVASECGLPIGGGRASFGYSFFPGPDDVEIVGGSYNTLHAPGHDSSDSDPDLDRNAYGGLLIEGRSNFVDVDPNTGHGVGGPNNDGVWQFARHVSIRNWTLQLNNPDRELILIRQPGAPVEMDGGFLSGFKVSLYGCDKGVEIKNFEGDAQLYVDGVHKGRIDKGYSQAGGVVKVP